MTAGIDNMAAAVDSVASLVKGIDKSLKMQALSSICVTVGKGGEGGDWRTSAGVAQAGAAGAAGFVPATVAVSTVRRGRKGGRERKEEGQPLVVKSSKVKSKGGKASKKSVSVQEGEIGMGSPQEAVTYAMIGVDGTVGHGRPVSGLSLGGASQREGGENHDGMEGQSAAGEIAELRQELLQVRVQLDEARARERVRENERDEARAGEEEYMKKAHDLQVCIDEGARWIHGGMAR